VVINREERTMKKLYAMVLVMMVVPFMAFAQEAVAVVDPDASVTLSGYALWMAAVGIVVGAASGLAALFPVPAVGTFWYWPRRILDLLAANFLNAKNAK